MSDWVSQAIEARKQRQREDHAHTEQANRLAGIVRAGTPALMARLRDQARKDVTAFNEQCEDEIAVEWVHPNNGFVVRRVQYPTIMLSVHAEHEGALVNVRYRRQENSLATPHVEDFVFLIEGERADTLLFWDPRISRRWTDIEELSQSLLRPLLFPDAHHSTS